MSSFNPKLGIVFSAYIADRTHHFTGREWVFQSISQWLHNLERSRYFLLTGEPGSGKTAIAAQLYQFSQGNESPLSNLPRNFLSAVHFCSARDSISIDPKSFARSIALQLAEKFPPFAHALKDVGEKQVNIHIEQHVETAENSTIQALVINNLDVSGVMSAQEAFDWVVLNPLLSIYQNGFDQPITILVDAIDEALTYDGAKTIVNLLSNLTRLPPQVRFILTSRKEVRVENKFEDVQELYLSDSEFNQLNLADIHEYIQQRLTQDEPLSTLVSGLDSHQREQSIDTIAEKSEGNFLYVRFLLDAIANGQRSFTEPEGLPEGLDGLYYQSLERVVKLGKQDWHTTYAPFMGILSVARTSLTLKELQAFTQQPESIIWKCLTDLRQFLEEVEPKSAQTQEESQYRLYHQSLIDFLRKRSLTFNGNKRHNDYYLSIQIWNQQIADYYWKHGQSLKSVDWYHLDGYGYAHLAHHLFATGRKQDLYSLLTASPDWMEAKCIACRGDSAYIDDLNLALSDLTDPLPPEEILILVQLHTARKSVQQRGNYYADTDLKTLVWLGRESEARSYALLRPGNEEQFQGLVAIASALIETQCLQSASDFLDEALKVAPPSDSRYKSSWQDSSAHKARKDLVCNLLHVGRFEESLQIAQRLASCYYEGKETLREVACKLAELGEFEQALQATQSIGDARKRFLLLTLIACNLALAGECDRAIATWMEVLNCIESNSALIESIRDSALKELLKEVARNLAQTGQMNFEPSAMQEIATLARSFLKDDAGEKHVGDFGQYLRLAQTKVIGNEGTTTEQLDLAQQMEAVSNSAYHLAKTGQLDLAQNALNEALKTSRSSIDRCSGLTLDTFISVAGSLAQANQVEQAQVIWNEVLNIALEAPKYPGIPLETSLKIVNGLSGIRQFASALQLARSTPDDERVKLLIKIAHHLAQAGEFEQANAILREALNLRPWDRKDILPEVVGQTHTFLHN